jgi:uncharacterized phiE125 gp8 family phage protein
MTLTLPMRPPWASPRGAWSVLLEPPIEEPITPANAKLRAGLDWPEYDPREALLADHIVAARQVVEQRTGLALLTQTRHVYVIVPITGDVPWPNQTQPLQSILSVAPASGGAALDPASYAPDAAGRVTLPAGEWIMDLVAGWESAAALAAAAAPLVQAVALLATHWATVGRDVAVVGTIAGDMPLGFETAIADYIPVRVI